MTQAVLSLTSFESLPRGCRRGHAARLDAARCHRDHAARRGQALLIDTAGALERKLPIALHAAQTPLNWVDTEEFERRSWLGPNLLLCHFVPARAIDAELTGKDPAHWPWRSHAVMRGRIPLWLQDSNRRIRPELFDWICAKTSPELGASRAAEPLAEPNCRSPLATNSSAIGFRQACYCEHEESKIMEDMKVTTTGYDFRHAHAAMQRYVDGNLLSEFSSAVLVGRNLVDVKCIGWADNEGQILFGARRIAPSSARGEVEWPWTNMT
jgi:hypothetical protein